MSDSFLEVFHSAEIKNKLKEKIMVATQEYIVISAFVKLGTLKWMDQYIQKDVRKLLLVRFEKSDLLSKATDYEIVEYCMNNNWDIRFDNHLHSKIYVFDRDCFIIGSANATNRGLSIIGEGNIETMVRGRLEKVDYSKIKSIFLNGNSFSSEIIDLMIIDLQNNTAPVYESSWSMEIKKNIKDSSQNLLLPSDLLKSSGPEENSIADFEMLGINISYDEMMIIERFKESKIYNWLINELSASGNICYFGELTAKLHEKLALNENMYRKDVKQALSNLLNWIEKLNIKEVNISRPNYSQLITLKMI